MRTNPVELELFRHLAASICDEMGIVLRKTSFSANIKERRDYSCALYDGRGSTVAMGDHMPVHLGAMPLSVASVLDSHELAPGDVVILNDPFRGGTHLPDITAVCGVFPGGARKPAFYLANRAHHADVGGMSPGSMPLAREIYQEGIRIPPVYLYRGGKLNRELLDLVLSNVRTPVEREGDLLAQHMSLRRGEQRLLELSKSWGLAKVRRMMRALEDYTETMMRATLAGLPDGAYSFEDALDDDGAGGGPVKIAAAITIRGDTAVIDFSGSAPQTAGPVNANYAITLSATAYVFRCLMDEEVPFTAGLLRPLQLIAPEGSIVNALPPAAMAAGNVETSQRIVDVVLGALAQAAPETIPAASSGTMNNLSLGGWDPFRNRPFAYYETIAGGMGAGPDHPGLDAVHTHMTNSWNTPIEALENQFPLRIRGYGVRSGSSGGGKRRGGEGVIREIEFLAGTHITILSDRRLRGPYGLRGGRAGEPGKNTLISKGRKRDIPGKATLQAAPGDVLRILTPGGGGHGRA